MTFSPPDNALGAELLWWREDGNRHTLVTIAGPLLAPRMAARGVVLTFALHDVEGRFVTSWSHDLGAEETLHVDSRSVSSDLARGVAEGALVVWVTPLGERPAFAEEYSRALTMVDWFSEQGELVTLHADQSVVLASRPVELTEIVFLETSSTRTSLVIVNGPEEQPPDALRIMLRNSRGDERAADYRHAMAPFSVHAIALGELTPELVEFCGGVEATLTGAFAARGVFTRPYVMTEGALVSGYHGGNRYPGAPIPRLVHRVFPYAEAAASIPHELMLVTGQKEMNPAYATHGPSLRTRLHLFQSHGDLEEDFFVDARLHDLRGRLIVHRERWAIAPRRGATTCDVAELTGDQPFEGHLALSFSDDERKEHYPRRVQALLEYRTEVSVARTMLWSDRWNAVDRPHGAPPYRALFRVFARGPRTSTLAVTNPSVALDYDRTAPYVIRLTSARGDELVHSGTLAPHATMRATIGELFPAFAGELAVATVESAFDLASMHLTIDTRSGVVAAEHLMAIAERVDGVVRRPCGA